MVRIKFSFPFSTVAGWRPRERHAEDPRWNLGLGLRALRRIRIVEDARILFYTWILHVSGFYIHRFAKIFPCHFDFSNISFDYIVLLEYINDRSVKINSD